MGGGTWHHDRYAGALVPGPQHPQTDDGSLALRRWRKSGSNLYARQGSGEAKALELKGWNYPRHLGGRTFAVVVHGDAEGADSVRRALHDWLADMNLFPSGEAAVFDRYVGYYKPYALSHDELDHDEAIFEETRNAARVLVQAVMNLRAGIRPPDQTWLIRARSE